MAALNELNAISPIDGRYYRKVSRLSDWFSEAALITYRVRVEVEYFIALCELPLPQLANVRPEVFPELRNIYKNFTEADAVQVKKPWNISYRKSSAGWDWIHTGLLFISDSPHRM
jgi:adenylosuccinate lyase